MSNYIDLSPDLAQPPTWPLPSSHAFYNHSSSLQHFFHLSSLLADGPGSFYTKKIEATQRIFTHSYHHFLCLAVFLLLSGCLFHDNSSNLSISCIKIHYFCHCPFPFRILNTSFTTHSHQHSHILKYFPLQMFP